VIKTATRKAVVTFTIKRLKSFWEQFRKSRRGMTGVLIVVFFVFIALFAPWVAPYPPINPMADVGLYPAYGPAIGRKIAMPLCYPAWYKYMPNVHKGKIDLSEEFVNKVIYIPELKKTFQLFGPKGAQNISDDVLLLSKRVSILHNITATYPNGTSTQLPSSDYSVKSYDPREIMLTPIYPNATTFEVDYTTGVDIVENMEITQDPAFSSQASINQWLISKDQCLNVGYNSTQGFSNDGCVEISCSTFAETAKVNLTLPFQYPYWEPPRQLLVHFSFKLVEVPNASITFFVVRKDTNESFKLMTYKIGPSSLYQSKYFDILAPEVINNLGGSTHPTDLLFAYPSNYTFSVRIIFQNPNVNTKLYLDNVHCVLYGNAFGLLGTDNDVRFPKDIFSTLVYGTRISLTVGVLSAVFSTVIGLFLGLVSGYVGGIIDEGIMRFADLLLVLPTLPLFIVLIIALRSVGTFMSIWNIIIIITFFGWMGFARSVRSMVISLRERTFIEAAKSCGASTMHIINRHILPNVFALVYITLATAVPGAIILEASLSWMGLGDPLVASWGKILYDFQSAGVVLTKGLVEYWFWVFPACIAIALLATAFILMGYALDEILNPRLRERR
jgi:ABC-type dipeptide/oligopeptide/nickel transport system permease subunit